VPPSFASDADGEVRYRSEDVAETRDVSPRYRLSGVGAMNRRARGRGGGLAMLTTLVVPVVVMLEGRREAEGEREAGDRQKIQSVFRDF
jgi:hypothetical protein